MRQAQRLVAGLTVVTLALAASHVIAQDWKSKVTKKVLSEVAAKAMQEALEEGLEEAVEEVVAIQRPIVGDPVCGRQKAVARGSETRALLAPVLRQMLHAWRLEIDHPRTGERLRFESPMPEDMERLILGLEARNRKLEGEK